jgi:hypothetical protein
MPKEGSIGGVTRSAYSIDELQRLYHEGVIDGVALVAADATACATCTALADRVYLPSQLPSPPIPGCTRPEGCRCRQEPSFTVYE